MNSFDRTARLIGEKALQGLRESSVAVFGLGGVGGFAFEALLRAGIGTLFIVDCDSVDITNLNRQILATHGTIGRKKTDIALERARLINPEAKIIPIVERVTSFNVARLVNQPFEYAIEAIDVVPDKLSLITELHERRKTFVVCLGAARRLDPTSVKVADISKTFACPLARQIRLGLRKRGLVKGVTCVFSSEQITKNHVNDGFADCKSSLGKNPQGSLSYVPGLIGLTAAGLIIKTIVERNR